MPERYVEAILKHIADRSYRPVKPRQLARVMGVADADYGTFREAVKRLRESRRIVLGERNAVMLPQMTERVVGTFRANPRGFGFVVPDEPTAHGDLYVPEGASAGAMTGDRVVARVRKQGKRDGQTVYAGVIVEIVKRADHRYVGTLEKADETWFVLPDGGKLGSAVVIPDVGAAGPGEGTKVVVEIVSFPKPGGLPTGVIVESLGAAGPLGVETEAVIRAYGLEEAFSDEALQEARAAVETFESDSAEGREDLSGKTIATIDPPDARDFDDAISLDANGDGTFTLGVHIADVSYFVPEGGPLDADARRRGTSVYFPRRVLPMLPKVLSNGVCSLQQDRPRYAMSAYITYDRDANVVGTRFAESIIRSAARLTYTEAQGICDGKTGGHDPAVVELVQSMERLARRIDARRHEAGMLRLDLPEIDLVFDDEGRCIDVAEADTSYTHTIIEMFMVEANEAVARLFERLERPVLRRIHPAPDPVGGRKLTKFVRAAGHKIPRDLDRKDLQALLESVKGKPESFAVNMAVLKMQQQAEYAPMDIGHYALASRAYCHFTSPIRRYPDLTVHRMLREHLRGRLETCPPEDVPALVRLGEDCTAAENRAESAERELREVMVLQLLGERLGEICDGVVTGIVNFGVFVNLARYGTEGLVRFEDLGDDWWEVDARNGQVRGERTGRTYRIGDALRVEIAGVDIARRELDLVPAPNAPARKKASKQKNPSAKKARTGKKPAGEKAKSGKGKAAKGKPGKRTKG